MDKDELTLEIGDVLQLQFLPAESQVRHYVKVIGYRQNQSLIVSTPQTKGKLMLIREGQPIAVRLLSGNSIVAFTVSVLKSNTKPYPYLHLSYPIELQAITVRKAQRVALSTLVKVQDCSPPTEESEEIHSQVEVKLEDMSTTGALLIHDKPLGEVKDLISVILTLHIAEAEEILNIIAVIRNVRERVIEDPPDTSYLHGIEFQFADRQESILLHAFVYEQIVNSHT
jgi:c-di-GMP-binding flagellar brake protein YcgR